MESIITTQQIPFSQIEGNALHTATTTSKIMEVVQRIFSFLAGIVSYILLAFRFTKEREEEIKEAVDGLFHDLLPPQEPQRSVSAPQILQLDLTLPYEDKRNYGRDTTPDFPRPIAASNAVSMEDSTLSFEEIAPFNPAEVFGKACNLLTYLDGILAFDAMQPIAFDQGNVIEDEDFSGREQFIYLLRETYGDALTKKLLEGPLQGKESIKKEIIFESLATLLVTLTLKDLRDLYKELLFQQDPPLLLKYLSANDQKALRGTNDFDRLETPYLETLYSLFSHVPIQGERVSLLEAMGRAGVQEIPSQQMLNLLDAMSKPVQTVMENVSQVDVESFARSEYFSKLFIYHHLNKGQIVPLFENGSRRFKRVLEVFNYPEQGLYAALIAPLQMAPQRPFDEECAPFDVRLVFRGTVPTKEGRETIRRDLDHTGVGKQGFDQCFPEILEKIRASLQFSSNKISLTIEGHSLGGCDAMRAAAYVTANLRANEKQKLSLSLITHNAPKVERELNDAFLQDAARVNFPITIDHLRFFGRDERGLIEDAVQRFGTHLLGFMAGPNTVNSLALHMIDLSENLGALEKHGATCFINERGSPQAKVTSIRESTFTSQAYMASIRQTTDEMDRDFLSLAPVLYGESWILYLQRGTLHRLLHAAVFTPMLGLVGRR